MATKPPARITFIDEFNARLTKIEKDAVEVGLNLTAICKLAHIGRATPDRWRREPPKTIVLIEKMEAVIERQRLARARDGGRKKH